MSALDVFVAFLLLYQECAVNSVRIPHFLGLSLKYDDDIGDRDANCGESDKCFFLYSITKAKNLKS